MKHVIKVNRYCTVNMVHYLGAGVHGTCIVDQDGRHRHAQIAIKYDTPEEMRKTLDHELFHMSEQFLESGLQSETVATIHEQTCNACRQRLDWYR